MWGIREHLLPVAQNNLLASAMANFMLIFAFVLPGPTDSFAANRLRVNSVPCPEILAGDLFDKKMNQGFNYSI